MDIRFISKRAAIYHDKRRVEATIFQEGEKVYLPRRNIKTKRPSDKLDFRKLGPYKIIRRVNRVNYELQIPKKGKEKPVHPVFHLSLFEKADQSVPAATHEEIVTGEGEYEVERILKQDIQ